MKNTTLPNKYAEALFKSAKEQSIIEKVKADLEAVNDFVTGSTEITKVMKHPGINRETKCNVIRSQFGDSICRLSKNFVFMLIDRKRGDLLDSVTKLYAEKVDEFLGIKSVAVRTAFEMSAPEEKKLTESLEKAFKKKVRLNAKTDAGIMGGIIIRDKMKLIDASVKQYLDTMKRTLKEKKVTKRSGTKSTSRVVNKSASKKKKK